jgi:predicted O-methyltransferase YrrM
LLRYVHKSAYKPGHFYSPIPDLEEVRAHESKIFVDLDVQDVDLNLNAQLELLEESLSFYQEFQQNKGKGKRYYSSNAFFNETDALSLYYIMRHYKPKRIIEVGSGFSSSVMLDTLDETNELDTSLVFIEPYPERLKSLLRESDYNRCSIAEKRVQDVDTGIYSALEPGDILFIDSSHISKVGSDLNFILFNILPLLKAGVVIHFHDICYPFEYPKDWIYSGIFWNEVYLLRAFLMNNERYKMILFNHMLAQKSSSWLKEKMPNFKAGGSLYLIKK